MWWEALVLDRHSFDNGFKWVKMLNIYNYYNVYMIKYILKSQINPFKLDLFSRFLLEQDFK